MVEGLALAQLRQRCTRTRSSGIQALHPKKRKTEPHERETNEADMGEGLAVDENPKKELHRRCKVLKQSEGA
jgi:hypothetical protein